MFRACRSTDDKYNYTLPVHRSVKPTGKQQYLAVCLKVKENKYICVCVCVCVCVVGWWEVGVWMCMCRGCMGSVWGCGDINALICRTSIEHSASTYVVHGQRSVGGSPA